MSADYEQELEKIWQQIDEASPPCQPVTTAKLERVIQALTELAESCGDASTWYALGYASYLHPDRLNSFSAQDRTRKALLRSLAIDPHLAHAWLYLGHHHYDLADYGEAARCFDQADGAQLGEYLRLKLEEMRTCCVIRAKGISSAMPSIARFVTTAESHGKEDVHPQELRRTLAEVVSNGHLAPPEADELQALCLRLDKKGGFRSWFRSL